METRVYLIMNYVKVGLDYWETSAFICPELYFQNKWEIRLQLFRLIYNIAVAPCVLS